MAFRLMQIVLPEDVYSEIERLFKGQQVLGRWQDTQTDKRIMLQVLVQAEEAEPLMDQIENFFSGTDDFNVILLPIAAILPRPASETEPEEAAASGKTPQAAKAPRVSREELYGRVIEGLSISRVFLAMVVLSSVVAAIGLRRNDLAVIIGAMVIAPLLGPNTALAFAVTLGDAGLARKSLRTNAIGVIIALVFALVVGLVFPVDPKVPAIASRTQVSFADLALALAAGSAGAFAFTSGLSGPVIGVMVAVALMPPLVVSGMLLGAGDVLLACRALLLTAANVICVNLAGVATFLAQGVGPLRWWEAERAKKATHKAIVLWTFLLAALVMILIFTSTDLASPGR